MTVGGELETRKWEQIPGLSKDEGTNISYTHAWYWQVSKSLLFIMDIICLRFLLCFFFRQKGKKREKV